MDVTRANCLRILILFGILQTNLFCFSQETSYPYKDWIEKLSDRKTGHLSGYNEILSALKDKDLSEANAAFNMLESKGSAADTYFIARFNLLKALWFSNFNIPRNDDSIQLFMKKALNAAYETDDESLVSMISWQYGSMMYWAGRIEPATMYSLYAAELDERAGRRSSSGNFTLLGDLLYRTRDYEKAIYYTKKSFEEMSDTLLMKSRIMSNQNTIALCWQRMGKYDSAFFYYDIAMRMAEELKDSAWISIISGNKGQVYFAQKNYSVAKQLLEYDHRQSKKFGELASAANSLQWVARIDLIEGKKDSALYRVKEALRLLDRGTSSNYLENVYYATADVYKAIGNYDSAYKYAQLYNQQHDSAERTVANSRLEIASIKLNNLQHVQTLKNLQREKDAEKLTRNFIISIIVLITVIVMFFLNRMRLKYRHNEQLALQQKAAAETEVAAANAELNMFKKNIIEKTDLIEKLQQQVDEKETSIGQQTIIDELTHQTILTEDEWEKFKSLFEKINPRFFVHLKEKSSDITIAEQRMAALMRLQLSSKQIASMLGISLDSVRKTRFRLRKRLGLSVEEEVEKWLHTL
jgi:tetratricopeptide (TPR) repeat protein/DNA-binding CsgD family transcriptional regulator